MLDRLVYYCCLLCMTGDDFNQSPRMYFVLLGITYLVKYHENLLSFQNPKMFDCQQKQ